MKVTAAYDAWHQNRSTAPQKDQPEKDETQAIRERERQAQRIKKRELARRQEHLETLEAQIHQYEAQMQELTTSLGAAGRAQDVGRFRNLGRNITGWKQRSTAYWKNGARSPIMLPIE